MRVVSIYFTVYFEDPFWVGIFEKNILGKLSVCRVVFGAEPKDYEIFEFILRNYDNLRYSPEVINKQIVKESINPKRIKRELKRQVQNLGIGTKSQQALKLQYEENKNVRRLKNREQKIIEKEKMFLLKQQKKKEKHKGR